jgi:hypothetical protein
MSSARSIKTVGLIALMAVLAMAVAATSASAVGGPVWIVLLGAELHVLGAGEKEAFDSEGLLFTLDGTTVIDCNKEEDTGEIIGGNPGTDLADIEFLECHVEGKPNCLATNVGEDTILTEVKTVLVYPHLKAETDEEALDAFVPDEAGNLFVEFTLKNAAGTTECGLLNGVKVNVTATGTEIKEPALNKNCGVLALVGKLNSVTGAFENTVAGGEALLGALNSEGTPTEAELWKPTAKTFQLIECKLQAFGAAATELGISDVLLVSGNEFGWDLI